MSDFNFSKLDGYPIEELMNEIGKRCPHYILIAVKPEGVDDFGYYWACGGHVVVLRGLVPEIEALIEEKDYEVNGEPDDDEDDG